MKEIEFQDPKATSLYRDYMSRLKIMLKTLSTDEQKDVLMEYNSHIYESLQKNVNLTEEKVLTKIISDLGSPEEVLKPLIAEKKLLQANRTANPIHIFNALTLNIFNGINYIISAILYMLVSLLALLCTAKIIIPGKVGLFYSSKGFKAFGIYLQNREGTDIREIAGVWFIPGALIATSIFYLLIILLLKLKKRNNK